MRYSQLTNFYPKLLLASNLCNLLKTKPSTNFYPKLKSLLFNSVILFSAPLLPGLP